MRRMTVGSLVLIIAVSLAFSAGSFMPAQKIKVADKVQLQASPFGLQDVRMLEGPFREAMLRDQQYLLELDSDRLQHLQHAQAHPAHVRA